MTKINLNEQEKEIIDEHIHLAFMEIFGDQCHILCIAYSNEDQIIMVKCIMNDRQMDVLFCTYAEIYADLF